MLDLPGFRTLMALPQPDQTTLVPYSETTYAPYGDITQNVPSLGQAMSVPSEAPCTGPACIVRCWSGIGANRLAIKSGFLYESASACIVGSTAGADSPVDGDEVRVQVAPNPVRDRLSVRLSSAMLSSATLRVDVYDVLGRLMETVEPRTLADRVELSALGLPPGLYVLRVSSGATTSSARFTVVR